MDGALRTRRGRGLELRLAAVVIDPAPDASPGSDFRARLRARLVEAATTTPRPVDAARR